MREFYDFSKSVQNPYARRLKNPVEELQESILNIKSDLEKYEEQYQQSSDEFYKRFSAAELDDREDYMIWAGLYEILQDNKKKLRIL